MPHLARTSPAGRPSLHNIPMAQPNVLTGLDVVARQTNRYLHGRTLGVLCNQASIGADFRHTLDLLHPLHQRGDLRLGAVFGPQHGLWGHTQDNMIEWEGYHDARLDVPVYSLYGARREPAPETLKGIDLFVVDIPDVGARSYTFLWTMACCMKVCQALGIPMMVLDRPNPIGGMRVEGPVLDPDYASFIGLHPLPLRHGMTPGEVARYLQAHHYPDAALEVVPMEGWRRAMQFHETEVPWAPPSPNMPAPDTAAVFPGMCLLEGTNLSEGRGTTRPFETFGAPYVDGWRLCARLNGLNLPGAYFRPLPFEPTFDKYAGKWCEGAFLHVTDHQTFEPVLTGVAVFQEVKRLWPEDFAWRQGPFEYVEDRLPIDILAGNSWIRTAVEDLSPLANVRERLAAEAEAFDPLRNEALLYKD